MQALMLSAADFDTMKDGMTTVNDVSSAFEQEQCRAAVKRVRRATVKRVSDGAPDDTWENSQANTTVQTTANNHDHYRV
jgi:hypothetical protein